MVSPNISSVSFVVKSPEMQVLGKIALLVAVLSFVVMHPEVYKVTNNFLHNTTDSQGNPTMTGKAIHAVVAGVAVAVILHFAPGQFLIPPSV
jgi:hypothetical protein